MAAEMQKHGLSNQLPDIPQILLEAQNRWLRSTEICQILSNYKKFSIAPEPPNRPPSGSLFLFDRKILRYFRKDGHIWRKKKDGKTVKEAHERLKVGSVDVYCCYAHGEENENFQRRTYWLLEEDFMNIVLVHYLEIKGGKQSSSRAKEADESARLSNADSPACSNSFASQSQVASQTVDAESPISGQISEYEDAETDNCRASSRYHPFVEMQQPVDGLMMDNLLGAPAPITSVNLGYQGEIQRTTANLDDHFVIHHGIGSVSNEVGAGLRSGSKTLLDSAQFSEPVPGYPTGYLEPAHYSSVATMGYDNLDDNSRLETFTTEALYTNNFTQKETDALSTAGMTASQMPNDSYTDGSTRYPLLKQSSLDVFKIEPKGLKKFDSFSRWMSDELSEVADLDIKSSSDAFWSTMNVADGSNIPINKHLDAYVVSPSLSQDQLFSIIDVSPSWAYTSSKIKVLITGTFLTNKEDVENCKWSCTFGDVEVPAEVLADGSLRCYTPVHQSGRVPFYVACSNRIACSEVREFEFRDSETQYMETADLHTTGINEMHLHIRLEKLLSLGPDDYEKYVLADGHEKSELINTISSLVLDDKISDLALSPDEKEFSAAQDKNLEKLVKEKLYSWLVHKIHDDEKGPNVLGKEGQGVIHLVAALGYNWAIRPIITAGVHVNFRDACGWTALHWAASCGRERTVGALITNGAASDALTNPTPQFPSGRMPADLASENGYKGIAGFLAESALTSHLSALTLKESKGGNVEEIRGLAEADDFMESSSAQLACQDSKEELLKDSLSAVRKSAQAAARIFQAFRVDSFQRKQLVKYGDDDCGLADERTLSLVSLKNTKPGQNDMPHSAAVRIQKNFRGWKGKKEFMITRQSIVKIQAHVRGHQVRRNYQEIIWSVGIVEKVILRWGRKGRGLRGFRPEKQLEGPLQIQPAKGEDEYDFLKDGRKQDEGRLQRALDRVKSMTQYPEAREQYSRLQTCVTELQESKAEMNSWLDVTSPMKACMSPMKACMSPMEACMSSSLGAMGPVLRKLDSLLPPKYRLSKQLQVGIQLLKEDLEEISTTLYEQSTVHSPNEMSNYWMNEVREISYDIDDFLEDMMMRHTKIRYVRRHRVGRVKTTWRSKTLKPCTRAAKIAELRALVREASERYDIYLDGCTTSPRCVSTTGHGQTPALYAVAANYLVGIDDSKTNLVQLLTDETEQQLKVVAVVGPAGVGKTTLANQVYRELEEQFECGAFVRASRKPDLRRLLAGILSQVQQCSGPSDSCTVQDLIDNLIKHLQDKRYVIVIDDLWETIAWDIVTSAFPEGNNCSRIVTTAQIEGVALECCDYQSNNILKMKPLGREDSMKLLSNMVFGPERSCPEQLKEVSDITITKCAGLPLAIICVAGLLASQLDNSEVRQHVQGYLCSNLSTNSNLEETLQEILKLSYNSLPHYLKTCLMYLSMYPEGYTMWKDDLVKQWVAECFISATEGQDREEVAESYFSELVNRGMIQPVEISYNDEVLSCTVHQVLLDLMTHKSNEEKFITALDYSQTITGLDRKARRLSLHFSNTRYATKPAALTLSKLRSLAFFGMLKCMPSFEMRKCVPSIVKFKLLRVLILEFWGDLVGCTSIDLRGICRLFQLRYLKISGDVSIEVEFPARMRRLQYLETLKINARVSAVPLDLPGLLHLSLGDETKIPYGIGRIRSLHTLEYFDLGKNSKKSLLSLGELIHLQDLRLTYSTVNSPKLLKRKLAALASSIVKLVNLKSVTLAPGALDTAIYHDCFSSVFSPPVFLQRLELSPICIFSRIPEWIGQLNKLCILKVVVRELLMKDMDMLTGLPALTILSLCVWQPTTESIIFKREEFPVLKYFKYTCGVLSLVFQEEALPNLHRLELTFNAHRGERYGYLLAGIEHLPNLKEITGTIGAAAGAEERDIRAADSAFKDAIRKHPRFPCYDSVKRVDRVDEEYNLRSQEDAIKCAASR